MRKVSPYINAITRIKQPTFNKPSVTEARNCAKHANFDVAHVNF